MAITLDTSEGPIEVTTTEPVPGLHVYEIPARVSPNSRYRWILAHHEGYAWPHSSRPKRRPGRPRVWARSPIGLGTR